MIDRKKIISIDETTLNRVLSKHFKDGFIIITADKSYITDPTERKERFKSLKRDIVNAGYSYIPVYGGYKETDPETGKQYDAPSFEYGLLVPNQKPFSNKSKNDDNLIELGKKLAAKYDQETFLYKPKGDDYNSYWVDANGNFVQNFKGLTINDMSQEFFTKLYHSKNPQKKDRRFTLVTEIYLNKAPNNASEAYERFGEQFFKL